MNDDIYSGDLHAWIEPEIEARVVALILGEASEFETEELERLMEERPEIRVFKRRLESVHGLLGVALGSEDGGDWKLSKERRDDLFKAMEITPAKEEVPVVKSSGSIARKERRIRKAGRRVLWSVAACFAISLFAFALLMKASMDGKREALAPRELEKAMSAPDAAAGEYLRISRGQPAADAKDAGGSSPAPRLTAMNNLESGYRGGGDVAVQSALPEVPPPPEAASEPQVQRKLDRLSQTLEAGETAEKAPDESARPESIDISFRGQLNYVGKDDEDRTVRPLDLRSGVDDEIVADNIRAALAPAPAPVEKDAAESWGTGQPGTPPVAEGPARPELPSVRSVRGRSTGAVGGKVAGGENRGRPVEVESEAAPLSGSVGGGLGGGGGAVPARTPAIKPPTLEEAPAPDPAVGFIPLGVLELPVPGDQDGPATSGASGGYAGARDETRSRSLGEAGEPGRNYQKEVQTAVPGNDAPVPGGREDREGQGQGQGQGATREVRVVQPDGSVSSEQSVSGAGGYMTQSIVGRGAVDLGKHSAIDGFAPAPNREHFEEGEANFVPLGSVPDSGVVQFLEEKSKKEAGSQVTEEVRYSVEVTDPFDDPVATDEGLQPDPTAPPVPGKGKVGNQEGSYWYGLATGESGLTLDDGRNVPATGGERWKKNQAQSREGKTVVTATDEPQQAQLELPSVEGEVMDLEAESQSVLANVRQGGLQRELTPNLLDRKQGKELADLQSPGSDDEEDSPGLSATGRYAFKLHEGGVKAELEIREGRERDLLENLSSTLERLEETAEAAQTELFFEQAGAREAAGFEVYTWDVPVAAWRRIQSGQAEATGGLEVQDLLGDHRDESGPMVDAQEALERYHGVAFPEGSSAIFVPSTGKLVSRNNAEVNGLIDRLVHNSLKQLEQKREALKHFEKSAAEEPFSTFSLNVSDVSFKLAKAALDRGEWPAADQIRVEEFINAFDYGDPAPTQEDKVSCQLEQAAHPFLQQRNLLRISMRTAALGRLAGTPLRLTVLLDNSGSMDRADRVESLQNAFRLLADQLNPQDQVTLISFARSPRLLADRLTGNRVAELASVVETTPSEGGTNIEEALRLGIAKASEQFLEGGQNRIVLLTDGAANLGNARPEELAELVERMRQQGIAFDACGVGAEGLNDEILESLTRKGDGRYYFLDRPEDADAGFAKQIAGALRPAARNVKVQVNFNPQRVGRYRLHGFQKHRLEKEDFRNDSVDAAELAAEEAGNAIYQLEVLPEGEGEIGTVSVRFQDTSTGQMVEKQWTIPYDASAPRLEDAEASLRLASGAALLGEKIKGSVIGEAVEMGRLARLINSLPADFPADERVGQLVNMTARARELAPE